MKFQSILMKTTSALLCAVLLVTPAGLAKTVSVEVPWEKARTIMAEGDFRPKIWVELQSSERLKGKLIEATGTGLRLVRLRHETKIAKSGSPGGRRRSARFERQGSETLIAREDIRTIRLRPRKTTRYKYRLIGLLVGIPAGFGMGHLGGTVAGGGELDYRNGNPIFITAFIATLIAVPYWFYKLGARADRGTVLIVLDESAPDSSRDGSQAERLSSAKGE